MYSAVSFFVFFLPQFIDLVCRGQEIMQFGNGSTSRDYTYISDIVDGVIRSLDRPAGYQIYNLGNGSPVSLSSFIKLVEESVGTPAKIRICPEQPGDVPRTCADVTKARAMLGYDPRVSFADGIRSTVKWYQERLNVVTPVAAPVTTKKTDPFTVRITHDARENRSRSLSCASAGVLDREFCANGGGGNVRPRSMSKPGLELAPRSMSCVSEGNWAAY